MSQTDLRGTDERAAAPGSGAPAEPPVDTPDDPLSGIPAELRDGTAGYDTDTAGGCG